MSEIKTVMHDGQVYQLRNHYLFSDTGVSWEVDELISIDNDVEYKFEGAYASWKYCIEIPSDEIGTITPAPIELIDGNAYIFDYKHASYIGIYTSPPHRFILVDGFTLSSYCTNIRLMIVESK
jgi:hypothetical protein